MNVYNTHQGGVSEDDEDDCVNVNQSHRSSDDDDEDDDEGDYLNPDTLDCHGNHDDTYGQFKIHSHLHIFSPDRSQSRLQLGFFLIFICGLFAFINKG